MSKQEELGVNDNRYMYGRITLIPCTYLITILLGYFVSIQVAGIFPVIIGPAVISLARVFGSMKEKTEGTNL
jgi:hypothetical protein